MLDTIEFDLEWEKGLPMNKFFPLPILAALLGAFLILAHFTSAYAQQHDSPASAQQLNADHPISLMLSAYATEYFYFFLPNTEDSIPTITLSDSSGIHIQLYDSRESSLKYAISSSHIITFRDSLSAGERYFLKLSNQSSQNKKLKITLRYTVEPKETAKPKKSARPKISTKPKKSVKPKASTKPKEALKPKTSTKPKISGKATKTTIHTPKLIATPTSAPTPAPQKSANPKNFLTPTKPTNPTTTSPNSKSNFLLSTHFLRIKAGTSLAIAEALNLSEESSSLSYQSVFSDRISIQNGILYARSPGIAMIKIVGDNFKSSCTICIQ